MQEEPPEYVPSKKAKRRSEPDIKVSGPAPSTGPGSRRQSSAFPAGEEGASEVGGYADEDASEDEASRHGSVAPVAQQQPPFAGVAQPKTEDLPVGDPYALPGGSPALAATLSLPDNPLLGLASASAALLNSPFPPAGSPSLGTMLNGSSSPVLPVNGRPLPGNNPSAAPDASTTFHPRLVARHASASLARPPLVSRFELRCSPSGATYSLDNSSVRQHALAVPSDTEHVEIRPVLASAAAESSSSSSSSKGKSRASASSSAVAACIVAARTRPAALVALEEVAELPPAPGLVPDPTSGDLAIDVAPASSVAGGQAKRYGLKPRRGLSTVEFVAGPAAGAEAQEGEGEREGEGLREGEEVYRVFVTR